MVEVVFDRTVHEKVITQTLTGDPVELAKKDPILVTEIRSPFDESVEGYVRERIKHLKACQDHLDKHQNDGDFSLELLVRDVKIVVPGVDAIEDEVEKVQGRDRLAAYELINGPQEVTKSGSWYSWKTGRRILGYPCSYSKFRRICFPTAQMEMKGGRPVWVIPEK